MGTKRIAVLAGATLIGLGIIGAWPPNAMAVSCYGDYCSGQDPMATGCAADAETLAFRDVDSSSGRLELRWSPICKSAWARWEQFPRGWDIANVPYALLTVQDTGYQQVKSYGLDTGQPADGTTTWSPMVYSPSHGVKAEVLVSCGDVTLFGAAMDCAMNGRIDTEMK